MSTTDKGKKAEDLAVVHLEQKGYKIMERNYRFMKSEVDIVAYHNFMIIFIEVKYRSNTTYGRPEEYVTEAQQKRIYEAAEAWLYERKMEGSPVRFDVVSIVKHDDTTFNINHIEKAFSF